MNAETLQPKFLSLLSSRRGHFRYISGHHGDLWLDLDLLFLHPARLRPFCDELAKRLSACRMEGICGAFVGGGLVAQMVAEALNVQFYYTARAGADCHLPESLRREIRGKRIAVVDDVINAGSDVRATLAEIKRWGATPAAIGALLVLGNPAAELASQMQIPLETIAAMRSNLWSARDCPLCASGVALEAP